MAERPVKTIDERFDDVTQAFLDQRDFTMFCHDKLRTEIRESEARLSGRIDGLDRRFDGLDRRVGGLAGKVDGLDRRVGGLAGKVDGLERSVGGLESKVDGMATAIDRRFTRNELLLTEILNEVKKR